MEAIRILVINNDRVEDTRQGTTEPGGHGRGLASLTQRELHVLALIGKGADNDEIARISRISKRTVETHIYHIYAKLGLKDRSRAAIYAIRHGLVD